MKKVFGLVVLVSVCLLSILSAQSRGITGKVVMFKGESIILYEKSYALLIGVSQYRYWPDLENIPDEITALEKSLQKSGFIVQTCLNPTAGKLKGTIENFINEHGLKPGNRLLIYFSGHGYTRRKGKKGYIVPADAVNPKTDEIGFIRKAIEMEQIITWARRIEAKHALFVFDSCFSGTVFKTRTLPTPGYISYLTGKPVRQFITAGSADEIVPSKSYFTQCFIRGIEGEADSDIDGYITGSELGLYLQKKIIGYKTGQTPQFGKIRDPELDRGDFVFINRAPTAPPPVDIDVSPLEAEKERIQKEREIRAGWARWERAFFRNVEKLEEYDQNADISSLLKKQKWQELLKAYNKNNPYSKDDEKLRKYATERIAKLEFKILDDKIEEIGVDDLEELMVSEESYSNPFGEEINNKAKRIYKNSKGFWEADYGDDIIMVYIPPGEYTMGSNDGRDDEKPPHNVYLDGYWMGKHEVTFDQYDKYCEETKKKKPDDEGMGRGKRPVINVSWDEANAYCDWLSEKTGLRFKLPTEAQWEKAARTTDHRKYPWGERQPDTNLANFNMKIGKTTPVGSYPDGASPYGLLDMAGNVWECCSDWYKSDYYKDKPKNNPAGPISGFGRVARGGGWSDGARNLRCAYRINFGYSGRGLDSGFRLCMED